MEKTEMSKRVEPVPVLRICSCITRDKQLAGKAEQKLVSLFGRIALKSEWFPFDKSNYYSEEMGENLERIWFCFKKLTGAENLVKTRLITEEIEKEFLKETKRSVNLDPGYLDFGKLVLASFKEAPDKIYMGNGVWAHMCLRYRFGEFVAPDHSFPDFKDGRFNSFLLEARKKYRNLLKQNM